MSTVTISALGVTLLSGSQNVNAINNTNNDTLEVKTTQVTSEFVQKNYNGVSRDEDDNEDEVAERDKSSSISWKNIERYEGIKFPVEDDTEYADIDSDDNKKSAERQKLSAEDAKDKKKREAEAQKLAEEYQKKVEADLKWLEEKAKNEIKGYDYLGEFEVTAYCSCEECCGKYSLDREKAEDGTWITYGSAGTRLEEGRSIAVDPEVIPYGSKVLINGKEFIAEDCGGDIKEKRIDVYFDSHEDATRFGRRTLKVHIKLTNDNKATIEKFKKKEEERKKKEKEKKKKEERRKKSAKNKKKDKKTTEASTDTQTSSTTEVKTEEATEAKTEAITEENTEATSSGE